MQGPVGKPGKPSKVIIPGNLHVRRADLRSFTEGQVKRTMGQAKIEPSGFITIYFDENSKAIVEENGTQLPGKKFPLYLLSKEAKKLSVKNHRVKISFLPPSH